MGGLFDSAFFSTGWPAIIGTALVTYLLRIGGYYLMGHVTLTPPVRRGLEALPGCIFIAAVIPLALRAGIPGIASVLVGGGLMFRFGNEIIALFAAISIAAGLRAFGF